MRYDLPRLNHILLKHRKKTRTGERIPRSGKYNLYITWFGIESVTYSSSFCLGVKTMAQDFCSLFNQLLLRSRTSTILNCTENIPHWAICVQ